MASVACSIVAGVSVIVALIVIRFVYNVFKTRWALRSFPELEGNWLLGHVKNFINVPPAEIFKTVRRAFREKGKVWKLFLLQDTLLMVADPKIMEVVLGSQKLIKKSVEYTLLRRWLNDGLLLASGKKWLSRRRIITPTFHFKILEEFVEVFDRNSTILVDLLKRETESDKSVDIYPFVTLALLDVICETSMGCSINAQMNADSEYVQAVQDISYVLHLRIFDAVLRNNLTFPFTKAAKMERQALKIIHGFSNQVITSRRKELLEKNSQDSSRGASAEDSDLGIKKKLALLDVLLQSTVDGKPLSDADIREEVDTFIFEGHDTTASGVTFTLYCLGRHPDVQKRLVQEIHSVIGEDKQAPITLQLLNDMPYLESVIKEAMRLYPSVPMMGRMVEEDVVIGDFTIPKGVNIILHPFVMQRDPELFPDPEAFQPERFTEGKRGGAESPFAYVPFSAGPRNCIGQKFAMLSMKSMVSKILRNFEVTVDPTYKEPILVAEIVMKPENGVWLNLKPRV